MSETNRFASASISLRKEPCEDPREYAKITVGHETVEIVITTKERQILFEMGVPLVEAWG